MVAEAPLLVEDRRPARLDHQCPRAHGIVHRQHSLLDGLIESLLRNVDLVQVAGQLQELAALHGTLRTPLAVVVLQHEIHPLWGENLLGKRREHQFQDVQRGCHWRNALLA